MNDGPIDVTSVRVITSDGDRKVALLTPQSCLQILLNHAGNLNAFVKYFRAHSEEEKQLVLFAAKQMMKTDKALYREWEDAIQTNKTIRIELLQFEALERLEGRNQAFEEKETSKGVIIKVKEIDSINFAKLTMGDAFAARIAQAKARPLVRTSDNDEPDTESDDEDLRKAMEDA